MKIGSIYIPNQFMIKMLTKQILKYLIAELYKAAIFQKKIFQMQKII